MRAHATSNESPLARAFAIFAMYWRQSETLRRGLGLILKVINEPYKGWVRSGK